MANADTAIREFMEKRRPQVPLNGFKGTMALEIDKNDAIFFAERAVPKQIEQRAEERREIQEIVRCLRDQGAVRWLVRLRGVAEPVEMTHAEVVKLDRKMLLDFASDMVAKSERPRKL